MIARVGRPREDKFPVEVLCANEEQRKALQRELRFYLDDLPADRGILSLEEIWDYQRYHCGTHANIYGRCHWGYREAT